MLVSPLHVALVVVIVLLVFGGRRLPQLGRAAGRGVRGLLSGGGRDAERVSAGAGAPVPVRREAPGTGVELQRLRRRWLARGLLRLVPRRYAWLVRLLGR